jgi:glycosyltransferase involved in cell wall biosynthesis
MDRSDVDRFRRIKCGSLLRVEVSPSTQNDGPITEGMFICTTCGGVFPIVCYSGQDTDWPVTEAGFLAVPLGDREALAGALETVLSDESFRRRLAERSRQAHEKYFSWAAITRRFKEELHLKGGVPAPGKALETGAAARVESGSCATK